jgi:fumarate hydratase, class I
MSSTYVHHEIFPLGEDTTPYRLLSIDHVATKRVDGREVLEVDAAALTLLADQAMRDCQHLLRPGHLAQLRKIIDDPESSSNDRFVAFELLKNANIAAAGVLPMCQDTGTAIIMGWKGERRLDHRRRRGGAEPGHPEGLYRDQPAL